MRLKLLTALFVAAAVLLGATGGALAKDGPKRRVLVYSGRLLDEQGGPIGGVFPLTFALYTKARGGKSVWSESHFIAVDNGRYVVDLGRGQLIPRSVGLDQLYVGVRITGGPELVRERFVPEGDSPEEVIRSKSAAHEANPGGKAQGGAVDYAEKAGFAYVAEKADNSVRIDGLTLDQLKKALGGGGEGGGKPALGTNTFNAPSAGGEGGTPFNQLCPEGYVVTGLRGGSGLYIDRLAIICSPLETKKK